MTKYVKTVFELKSIIKCNMFIYYLEKLPFCGPLISRSLFRHTALKKCVALAASVFSIAAFTVVKSLCILFFGFGANLYLSEKLGLRIHDYSIYCFQSVFFLFCVLGAFQESRTFLVSKTKYICLAHMKMPVKEGILSFLINEYLIQFISAGFVFYIFCVLFLHNLIYFFALSAAYISLQLLSECVHLLFFKQAGIPLEKKKIFSLFLFMFSLAGAYGPLVLSSHLLIVKFLTGKFFISIYCVMGICSVYYIFFLYDGYNDTLAGLFKKESLAEELARKRQDAVYHSETEIERISTQKIKEMRGYRFINGLFVLRNKKQLFKYLKRRLIFLTAVFISAVIGFADRPLEAKLILNNIYLFVPLLPVIAAAHSYGEGFCKFYYTHFDSKLLVYSFYRTRKAILQNYFMKLRLVLKYNFLLAAASGSFLLALFCMARIDIWNIPFLLLEITVFALYAVFGIQHVSVYYLFQPYIKNSTIQNPILFTVQMPVLILTYIFTMLRLPAVTVMLLFLIGGVVYALIWIFAVSVKSPAAFRLK